MDDTTFKIQTKAGEVEANAFGDGQFIAFGMLSGSQPSTQLQIMRALLTHALGDDKASEFIVGLALGTWSHGDLIDLLILLAKKSEEAARERADSSAQPAPDTFSSGS